MIDIKRIDVYGHFFYTWYHPNGTPPGLQYNAVRIIILRDLIPGAGTTWTNVVGRQNNIGATLNALDNLQNDAYADRYHIIYDEVISFTPTPSQQQVDTPSGNMVLPFFASVVAPPGPTAYGPGLNAAEVANSYTIILRSLLDADYYHVRSNLVARTYFTDR